MTFCRSIHVKKVVKLLAFIFGQPSYIVAIAKIADSQQIIAFNKLFVLHYSIN